ncbi:hypothetical protein [Amycolatopsis sp. NPDC004378]
MRRPRKRCERKGFGGRVVLVGGDRLGYTKLPLATGASPPRLRVPGNDLEGVHYLRRLTHADRLRDALAASSWPAPAGSAWRRRRGRTAAR